MRVQPIVLACQAERAPTFSSIPIWLQQLRKLLTVYQEDNALIADFKTLTVQVLRILFTFAFLVIRMFLVLDTGSEGKIRLDLF